MNRLTSWFNGRFQIEGYEEIACSKICAENNCCEKCIIQRVINKLAEYENIGTDPKEMNEIVLVNKALSDQGGVYAAETFRYKTSFANYVKLYDAIYDLQNNGILDEKEVQECEHNLLIQIIGMMHANKE